MVGCIANSDSHPPPLVSSQPLLFKRRWPAPGPLAFFDGATMPVPANRSPLRNVQSAARPTAMTQAAGPLAIPSTVVGGRLHPLLLARQETET